MKIFNWMKIFKRNKQTKLEFLLKLINDKINEINKDIAIHEKYNCNNHLKEDNLKKEALEDIMKKFNEN